VAVNDNASAAGAKEVVTELERLGRRAEAVRADVACADQVGAMVDQVLARFGRLDILVNNAGVMTRGQSSTPRSRATSRCSRST
jgi:3-oxoacyl-[acyl-carrier protein] reductase